MWRLAPSGQASFLCLMQGLNALKGRRPMRPFVRIVVYGILGNSVAMLLGVEL